MSYRSLRIVWAVTALACALCGCSMDDVRLGASKAKPADTIQMDCLVTFFSEGDNIYFSRHTHIISSAANTLRITAVEPGGTYSWYLSPERFSTSLDPDGRSPVNVIDRRTLTAILSSFIAVQTTRDSGPCPDNASVSIDGQWYASSSAVGLFPGVTSFKRLDTGTIDQVWVADKETQSVTIARSYNMQTISGTDRIIPGTIDILIADSPLAQPKRILRIDYLTPKAP